MNSAVLRHLFLACFLGICLIGVAGCSHQQTAVINGPGSDPAVQKAFAGNMTPPPGVLEANQKMLAAQAAVKAGEAQEAAAAISKGKQAATGIAASNAAQ